MTTKDIILISDDNYCVPTIVCVQSIINNIADFPEKLTIHVCTFHMLQENIKRLEELSTDSADVVVDIFNKDQLSDKLALINQKSHVTPTALIKFELPNYFSNIHSALYLDGDIVLKGSINDLLNTDISGYYLAASFEFMVYLNLIRFSLKRKYDFYFNSGVMLLNFDEMRKNDVTSKLWEYKLHEAKTKLMDQESLNAVCKNHVKPLSVIWNFNPVFFEKGFLYDINKIYFTSFADIEELLNCIRIIHYVGKHDKPWVYENALLREYWDNSNKSLLNPISLSFKSPEKKEGSLLNSIMNKIKTRGILGTLLYIMYVIRTKL